MIDKLPTTETSLTSSLIREEELKKDNVEFVCGDDKMFCLIRLLNTKKIHIIITKDLDLSCWDVEAGCEDLRQNDPHWSSFEIEEIYYIILESLSEKKFVFKIESQFARLEIPFQMGSVKFNLKIEIPEKKCDNDSLVSLQREQIRKLLKKVEKLEHVIDQLPNKYPKKVFLLTSSSWNYVQANWVDFPNAKGQVELKQDKLYKWDLCINGVCGSGSHNYTQFRLCVESDDKNVVIYQPSEAGVQKYLIAAYGGYEQSVQERNTLKVDKSALYTIKLQVRCSGSGYGINWNSTYGSASLFVEEIAAKPDH